MSNYYGGRDATDEKIERLEAELADLRASSVVVRRKCESCGGDNVAEGYEWASGDPAPPCPDCDNGWQLAEGVTRCRWVYVVPARRIDGEDT